MPEFARRIVDWQRTHGRHDLPWQRTRDAYRIWVAEIMLQQTQVATVIPYYDRFLAAFPDVSALARADESLKAGRDGAATRHVREAHEHYDDELRVAPDLLAALEGRAAAAARLGESAKAIRALEALRRVKPADSTLH